MYPNTSKPRLRKRNQRIKKERRSKELTYYCDLTKEMIQNHYLSWVPKLSNNTQHQHPPKPHNFSFKLKGNQEQDQGEERKQEEREKVGMK